MCYKGNFLRCIPIKWACLALGIFKTIAYFLLLVVYAFIWFKVLSKSDPRTLTFHGLFGGYMHHGWIPKVFLYVIMPFAVLLNLIFSILLCNGICQRRPRKVEAYFWYGVGSNVLTALVATILLSCDSEQLGLRRYSRPGAAVEYRIARGLWLLFGCVLRSLFLVLVHHTHKKLKVGKSFDHVRLRIGDRREGCSNTKGLHV